MKMGMNLLSVVCTPQVHKKHKCVNFSHGMQGSSGSGDKQRRVVPKIVGSIQPLLILHAVYHGKIPEVLKTAEARHVFIPLSYGKNFPVVDHCCLASSCVCTGISRSVL
jgi:hypothetical protein